MSEKDRLDSIYSAHTMLEWHEHNKRILKGDIIPETDTNTKTTHNCIVNVNQEASNHYAKSTEQLKNRERHINYWKVALTTAIDDISNEINLLKKLNEQVENASTVLKTPELINNECITIRTGRLQSDMIVDDVEKSLYKEQELIQNVKQLHSNSLRDIERQINTAYTVKDMLERDWSDKNIAFDLENQNSNYKTNSDNAKFYPGVTRLANKQSDITLWEHSTISNLNQFKETMDNSIKLRKTVEAVLLNTARDIRSQDMDILTKLNKRIAETMQVKLELEDQLKKTLQKIVEKENVMEILNEEILKTDQRSKINQTRLSIKDKRPNIENCREGSLISLINESTALNGYKTNLEGRYRKTELLRAELIEERSKLENEIIVKAKSLFLDNDRCLMVRSNHTSAEKLSGY